jgi:acetoin utilization deacetylase AcuC-like enzyme
MRKTGLVLDECFRGHDTGPGHPERPERLVAIEHALRDRGLVDQCNRLPLRQATPEQIHCLHRPDYVERLVSACRDGAPFIDVPDSAICPKSYDLAVLAAGSVIEAVDRVMAGTIDNAFCAVRPPGHHALDNRSMGFCLLNNVALAADHLTRSHRLERVLIVDWDVHHGNGTQALFESRRDVMYISLHGDPRWVYPGTSGWPAERGVGQGEGFTLNLPMQPGSGDPEYRQAFDEAIAPVVAAYRPEFVLISAGFDAHRADPLAPIELDDSSYDWMTTRLLEFAAGHAANRLVSVLEGGYDLDALGRCVAAHVAHLADAAGQSDARSHGREPVDPESD